MTVHLELPENSPPNRLVFESANGATVLWFGSIGNDNPPPITIPNGRAVEVVGSIQRVATIDGV